LSKWVVLIVWGVIFLIGLGLLSVRQLSLLSQRPPSEEISATAVRQMATNHLILPSDLEASPHNDRFAGRYALLSVSAGQILKPDDTSSIPLLTTENAPLFAVRVEPSLVQDENVDVGSLGKVVNGEETLGSAKIVVIFCRVPVKEFLCMALVSMDASLGEKLVPNKSTFSPNASAIAPKK